MTALTTSVEENPMGSYHQSGTFFNSMLNGGGVLKRIPDTGTGNA